MEASNVQVHSNICCYVHSILLSTQYYNTISEAIQNTPEHGRILVHPGVYKESFVLSKPISLIGASPERVLIVGTSQTVIEVSRFAKNISVSNMEIKV